MSYRSITDYRGTFVQGSTTTLFVKFMNDDGESVDPESMTIRILDDNNEEIIVGVPERIGLGAYIYDWEIATDETVGPCTALWAYNDGVGSFEVEQGVMVIADGDAGTNSRYAGRLAIFRQELELMLCCAQAIPVKDEQGIPNQSRNTFSFTFSRWNQAGPVRVYRNQKAIGSGYNIDYFKAKVIFDENQSKYDVINADYTFRWFSDEQLDRFLNNALAIVNLYPPSGAYGFINVPDRFVPVILYGAAKDALRELLLCLQFQQPQKVFGGPEAAQRAFQNIETLKKNYEEEFKGLLEQKKFGPYPSSKAIVVPEFTMPGGKCLLWSSKVNVLLNGAVCEMTLKDLSEQNLEDVKVYSHNEHENSLEYVPVSKIWESGIKKVSKITTIDGFEIYPTDEHMIFANGEYVPSLDLVVGDNLLCINEGNMISSEIVSIYRDFTEGLTFDLEIPSNKNLFVGGVKCHNSRWFRYLFGSGSS